jgi:ATP-dependent Clp protease ATP-binding subunit ClpA
MSQVDFTYWALTQLLDERFALAEGLAFPEISRLGPRAATIQAQLDRNLKKLLEEEPLADLHRRRASDTPVVDSASILLDPVPGSNLWREPLPLVFPVLRWVSESGPHLASVPSLGIVIIAGTEKELAERLPDEIRAALGRVEKVPTLPRLVACQRAKRIRVERAEVRVRIRSSKQRVQATEAERDKAPSVLAGVATDLTGIPNEPVYGMDAMVEKLAELLTARQPRSVLLIGPSGVGKTALVRELVRCRAALNLGATPFFSTSGARLVAGMTGYGMWQDRCRQVVREAARRRAILHLGNLVELMEVGKSEYNSMGIAAFLRTWLARGDLLAVVECTQDEYPAIERQAPHLLDVFDRLPVPEPTVEQSRNILAQVAAWLVRNRGPVLPADALDTLDRLHRRYATYSAYPGRPLRFLRNLLRDVGGAEQARPADIYAEFTRETGLPRVLLDPAERLDLDTALAWFSVRVRGQDEAVRLVVDLLATAKAGLARPRKPIASLLFIGPTGVGKTETAKALAEYLFGSARRLTRFDMSEYSDPVAVGRLIGGVFGSEGLLTARVREQPFSVVLLDEFEKAHPRFYDVLLQVLGEGRLTDAAGRVADFCNTVIILTSNLGAQTFQQGAFGFSDASAADEATRREAARDHFAREVQAFLRPELFNRIDRLVPFAPLAADTIRNIADGYLRRLEERDGIRFRGVAVGWQPGVAAHLGKNGFDIRYGARPLLRAVERELLAPLADQMNGYSTDTPLDVQVGLDGERLRIGVRARGTATGTAAALLEAIEPCVDLRRLHQALERCRPVRQLRNELHRLETDQKRREKVRKRQRRWLARLAEAPEAVRRQAQARQMRVDAAEQACLARIGRLKLLTDRVQNLGDDAAELEEQALETLYARAGEGLSTADLEAALKPLLAAVDELLLVLYCREFEMPGAAFLAVFSEQRDHLVALAWAYRDVAQRRGLGVTETAYLLPSREQQKVDPPLQPDKPTAPKPNGDAPTPDPLWREDKMIVPAAGRHPERVVLVREKIREFDEFLAEPRDGLLGLGLALKGEAAMPRFVSEGGLHVFPAAPNSPAGTCLVEVSPLTAAAYLPPIDIARKGAIGNQDQRRTYARVQEMIDDSLVGRFRWSNRVLRDVLDEALETLLRRRRIGLLEE